MRSEIYICILMFMVVSSVSSAAPEPLQQPQQSAAVSDSPSSGRAAPEFPYTGVITGSAVNVRSGPGTDYYSCGQLNKSDRVEVVGGQYHIWSQIVPPAGSFSWILKEYVRLDVNDPSLGTVTGEPVRVYAGSPMYKPMHSTTVQVKLDKGEKVRLIGEETDGYYKIYPPANVYLWVSSDYISYAGPADEAEQPAADEPVKQQQEPLAPRPELVEVKVTVEDEMLRKFYLLQERIEKQRKKTVTEQDYVEIKEQLREIADEPSSGKAARYAEYGLRQIDRIEMAFAVDRELQLQTEQLAAVYENIEDVRSSKMQQLKSTGEYAVTGLIRESSVFEYDVDKEYYVIIDGSGNIICYAVAADGFSEAMAPFMDTQVGLIGEIVPHEATSGALVVFSGIEKL